MRRKKGTALLCGWLAFALLLSGCDAAAFVRDVRGTVAGAAKWGAEVFDVLFAEAPETGEGLTDPAFVDFPVSRLLYDGLSAAQQEAYRAIYNEAFSQPEKIRIPKLTEDELSAVMLAVRYDNPWVLGFSASYSYAYVGDRYLLKPDYTDSAEENLARSRALVEAAKLLLRTLQPSAETGFEKELLAHDALCARCAYGESPMAATAYGALVEGKAICEGYALAAKLLFDLLGLESVTVRGTGVRQGEAAALHMWNAVRLDSGWYYLDCTWDDPVTETGDEAGPRHFYFNVTEETLRRDHADFQAPAGVSCVCTEENYFRRLDLYCTEGTWREIAARVIGGAEAGETAELLFSSGTLLGEAVEALFTEGWINELGAGGGWRRYGYSADADTCGLYLAFYET